jgi:hypothetical protein
MPDEPTTRSVKISADERTGWSSERPRRDGSPPRPPDVSVRSRVLSPSDQLRYSPGSLLVIVSGSAPDRDRFAKGLIDSRSLLSLGKVRELLAGRTAEEEIAERAQEVLDAAVTKRMEAGETVVVTAEGLDAGERERYVRIAARAKRPRHLILVEANRADVQGEDRAALNDLRRRLDAGELGQEGFQTALRIGGDSVSELKRIVFRPPPRDD